MTGALAALAALLLSLPSAAAFAQSVLFAQPIPASPTASESDCCETVDPVTTSPTISAEPTLVEVPPLKGQTVRAARSALRAQSLWLSGDDPDWYVVVAQYPPAGRQAVAGTGVTVEALPPDRISDPPSSPSTGAAVDVRTAPGKVPGDPPAKWGRTALVGGGIALVALAVLGLLTLALRRRPRRPAGSVTTRAVTGYRPPLLSVAELPGRPTLTVALRPAVEPGNQTITEAGRPA